MDVWWWTWGPDSPQSLIVWGGVAAPGSQKFTPKRRQEFLAALARCGNVSEAAEACGLSRVTLYHRRREDAEFAEEWRVAADIGAGALEDEAIRRAHDGVDEPIYRDGVAVGSVTKYSDTLLIFLLKGAKPDKYRERTQTEHTGNPTLTVRYENDWRAPTIDTEAQ